MENANKRLSTLTTIQKRNLDKLSNIKGLVIADIIMDAVAENEKKVEIDVGFGVLAVSLEDNVAKFRFEPNAKLKEGLLNRDPSVKGRLEQAIEASLKDKIENTYKDLL